jgi:ferredoxin-NADP reductase
MQLSDRSRPLIEATLPVVGEHINEITKHFYRHMFAGHPELLEGAHSQLPLDGVFPGEMDISQLSLPDNACYHLCGPIPFMHEINSALTGRSVSPKDIQYEVFGPDLWHADFK